MSMSHWHACERMRQSGCAYAMMVRSYMATDIPLSIAVLHSPLLIGPAIPTGQACQRQQRRPRTCWRPRCKTREERPTYDEATVSQIPMRGSETLSGSFDQRMRLVAKTC